MATQKKFNIRCDLEGVSGVVRPVQSDPSKPEYSQTCEWFMEELLAMIEGLYDGGATEVVVYDEHWFGTNIDMARLPRGVKAICGKPPYQPNWAGGIDSSFAGYILHGFHSMEGTGHLLAHTYEPDFKAIRLNGVKMGEIGMESAIAGDWGVPLVMITADDKGVEEAQKLIPGVVGVATKISRALHGGECFALEDNCAKIYRAAAGVAEKLPAVKPYKLKGAAHFEADYFDGPYVETLRKMFPKLFIKKNTICIEAKTATAAWAKLWQCKLAVQAELAKNA